MKNTLSFFIGFLVAVLVLEFGAKNILESKIPEYKSNSLSNRILSGYYIFKNRPDYTFEYTYKNQTHQNNIYFDEFGFIKSFTGYKKTKNDFRIFICGGSTAISAGQTKGLGYEKIHDYPSSIYAYEISIAGFLEQNLKKIFPEKNIQIINTASYQRQLHQSQILYLETITHLQPDLVISIDGFNDLRNIFENTNPYYSAEDDFLPKYVNFFCSFPNNTYSNLLNLINLILKKKSDNYSSQNTLTKEQIISYSSNLKIEKQLLQFNESVKLDSSKFLFVLQPIIYLVNDFKFTESEQKFKSIIDTDISFKSPIKNDVKIVMDKTGEKLKENGGFYLNTNNDFLKKDSNQEIFTDYCHLTIDGNKLLADLIFETILKQKIIE